MSSDGKFFIFVVIAAVAVLGGIIAFGGKNKTGNLSTTKVDTQTGQKLGPDSAPVKIVEVGDFQCPACALAATELRQAEEKNRNQVQVIYRHFPLPSHSNAVISALAAEAAGEQNKFWEMYDLLYARQQEWSSSSNPENIFVGYADSVGLDENRFLNDLKSDRLKARVESDKAYANSLGVNQTPTFYINDKQIIGVQSAEAWQKLIEEAKK